MNIKLIIISSCLLCYVQSRRIIIFPLKQHTVVSTVVEEKQVPFAKEAWSVPALITRTKAVNASESDRDFLPQKEGRSLQSSNVSLTLKSNIPGNRSPLVPSRDLLPPKIDDPQKSVLTTIKPVLLGSILLSERPTTKTPSLIPLQTSDKSIKIPSLDLLPPKEKGSDTIEKEDSYKRSIESELVITRISKSYKGEDVQLLQTESEVNEKIFSEIGVYSYPTVAISDADVTESTRTSTLEIYQNQSVEMTVAGEKLSKIYEPSLDILPPKEDTSNNQDLQLSKPGRELNIEIDSEKSVPFSFSSVINSDTGVTESTSTLSLDTHQNQNVELTNTEKKLSSRIYEPPTDILPPKEDSSDTQDVQLSQLTTKDNEDTENGVLSTYNADTSRNDDNVTEYTTVLEKDVVLSLGSDELLRKESNGSEGDSSLSLTTYFGDVADIKRSFATETEPYLTSTLPSQNQTNLMENYQNIEETTAVYTPVRALLQQNVNPNMMLSHIIWTPSTDILPPKEEISDVITVQQSRPGTQEILEVLTEASEDQSLFLSGTNKYDVNNVYVTESVNSFAIDIINQAKNMPTTTSPSSDQLLQGETHGNEGEWFKTLAVTNFDEVADIKSTLVVNTNIHLTSTLKSQDQIGLAKNTETIIRQPSIDILPPKEDVKEFTTELNKSPQDETDDQPSKILLISIDENKQTQSSFINLHPTIDEKLPGILSSAELSDSISRISTNGTNNVLTDIFPPKVIESQAVSKPSTTDSPKIIQISRDLLPPKER